MDVTVSYSTALHRTVRYNVDKEAYEEWLSFQGIHPDEAGRGNLKEFILASETVAEDLEQSHEIVSGTSEKVRIDYVYY